jgi:hypothetical protein
MSPEFESVGSDVLHVYVHGVELNASDLAVFVSAGLTRMEQKHIHFGNLYRKGNSRESQGERAQRYIAIGRRFFLQFKQ